MNFEAACRYEFLGVGSMFVQYGRGRFEGERKVWAPRRFSRCFSAFRIWPASLSGRLASIIVTATLVTCVGAVVPADAATCPTPQPAIGYIGVTTGGGSDTAICGGGGTWYGDDNNGLTGSNGTNDAVIAAGWTLLAEALDDSTDGALTVTGGTEDGTWYLDPASASLAGYEDFVLGLKDGNAEPNWAAFELGANALSTILGDVGTWFAVTGDDHNFDMSHVRLYAKSCPDTGCKDDAIGLVPLPAALPLLAGGIGVLGALGWLRRRGAAQA